MQLNDCQSALSWIGHVFEQWEAAGGARGFGAIGKSQRNGLRRGSSTKAESLRSGRICDHSCVGSWRSYLRLGIALLSRQHDQAKLTRNLRRQPEFSPTLSGKKRLRRRWRSFLSMVSIRRKRHAKSLSLLSNDLPPGASTW